MAIFLHLTTKRTSIKRLRACAVLQRPQQQSAGLSACRGVSLQNWTPCVSFPQRGPRTADGTCSVSGTYRHLWEQRDVWWLAVLVGQQLGCRAVRAGSGAKGVSGKSAGRATECSPSNLLAPELFFFNFSTPCI